VQTCRFFILIENISTVSVTFMVRKTTFAKCYNIYESVWRPAPSGYRLAGSGPAAESRYFFVFVEYDNAENVGTVLPHRTTNDLRKVKSSVQMT
jgi:hypothetical protein